MLAGRTRTLADIAQSRSIQMPRAKGRSARTASVGRQVDVWMDSSVWSPRPHRTKGRRAFFSGILLGIKLLRPRQAATEVRASPKSRVRRIIPSDQSCETRLTGKRPACVLLKCRATPPETGIWEVFTGKSGTVDKRIGSASTGCGAFLSLACRTCEDYGRGRGTASQSPLALATTDFLECQFQMYRIAVTPTVLRSPAHLSEI